MKKTFKEDQLNDLTEQSEHLSFDELLGEEVSSSFSWFKTILVILALLAAIFIGFYLFSVYSNTNQKPVLSERQLSNFEASKSVTDSNLDLATPPQEAKQPLSENNSVNSTLTVNENKAKIQAHSNKDEAPQENLKQATPDTWFRLIYSSHPTYAAAKQDVRRLAKKRIDSYIWTNKNDNLAYKVQLGAFKVKSRVMVLKTQLEAKGLNSLEIVFQ